MPRPTLTPDQQAQADRLAETLRPRVEQLARDLAEHLVANQDAPFGQPEFDLRDLLHRAGADALQLALGQKKTATTGRA